MAAKIATILDEVTDHLQSQILKYTFHCVNSTQVTHQTGYILTQAIHQTVFIFEKYYNKVKIKGTTKRQHPMYAHCLRAFCALL